MSKRSDADYLQDMLEAISRIAKYCESLRPECIAPEGAPTEILNIFSNI